MAKEATKKKDKTGAVIKYGTIVDRYKIHDVRTGSGKRRSVDNDDKVASALRGKTVKEWAVIAKENDIKLKDLSNPGMVRLALGNSLRRVMREQGHITVDGKKVKA